MRRRGAARHLLVRAWILALLATPACAEAEAPARAVTFPVQFETEDGFVLHGDLSSAADTRAPVAILLHMYRSDRSAWAPLVPGLVAAGFTVLALDQRAHGESVRQGERRVRVAEIPRERFGAVVRAGPRDVEAARRYLQARGLAVDRLVLVGASYGCTVALLASEKVENVRAAVLLSPGSAYFGVDVMDAARKFRGALLAVAAEDDPASAESVRRLGKVHPGSEVLLFPAGGHGTHLFRSQPALVERLVAFLATLSGD